MTPQKKDQIGVALLGLGTVGSGVASALLSKGSAYSRHVQREVGLLKVLVRSTAKKRIPDVPKKILTTDFSSIVKDTDIQIVIEAMGGEHPAFEYMKQAIASGKHVVTANKEVISKHGTELFALASKNKVALLFEASVGGGIPIIGPLQRDFNANEIFAIDAIINGTTNYILTSMTKDGSDFASALKDAQKLGYAEPDPANDIEGTDAAYKLAILATLAFKANVKPQDVYREGISKLSQQDFRYADELGYAIKLLAIARCNDGEVQARVHPVFIKREEQLAKVDGVYNAIQIEGDLVGKVLFYGRGAGAKPTSSAIIADLLEVARSLKHGLSLRPMPLIDPSKKIIPLDRIATKFYIRMSVEDRPGVLAQIAKVLGDRSISINSVIQKETDTATKSAEIVIMTHNAVDANIHSALNSLKKYSGVREIGNLIRVWG